MVFPETNIHFIYERGSTTKATTPPPTLLLTMAFIGNSLIKL